MKRALLGAFLFAAFLAGGPSRAEPSASPPILGRWSVDVSQLPVPPEARPRSVTMTFSEAEDGKYTTNVDITGADGSESHGWATYPLDGTAAPVIDSAEADTTAARMPSPDVLVMALVKNGVPASTRIYSVAPDGATMTEVAVYFRPDGTPVMRTNFFKRAG